jgi:hypothetical protein
VTLEIFTTFWSHTYFLDLRIILIWILSKLDNKELHDLYSSPSIIGTIKSRRMIWAGHVARVGEKRNAYRLLVGKPGGKRPLGRPRRRWVDNIRLDLGEVGWG